MRILILILNDDYLYSIMLLYIVIAVVLFVCLYFKFTLSYWKRKNVDGPSPLPLFGNLFDYIGILVLDASSFNYSKIIFSIPN